MKKPRTVSAEESTWAQADKAVEQGLFASISALTDQALRDKLQRESLSALLAEWTVEFGTPSDADYAWAREVLDD